MNSVTFSPPHASLFVFDPTNKDADTPPWIDDEQVSATENCVWVKTQAYVDGDVEVSLGFSDAVPVALHHVFSGSIVAPGGKVAVVTSELDTVLETDVPKGVVDLSIWVDDRQNAARVAVQVRPVMPAQVSDASGVRNPGGT